MNSTRNPRARSLAVVALTGALLLGACGGSSGAGDGSEPPGSTDGAAGGGGDADTLVIADNEPPQTFDPIQAGNSTVDEVVLPVYDPLVDYDAANELSGRLADSWEVADDGLSIDFVLRDDITFHDGSPVTSADVQYTLDRAKELAVGVWSEITVYDSVEITDDQHFTINLTDSFAPFVPALSRVYILNADLVEENRGDDFGQTWLSANDAGSGPYELVEYVTDQQAEFTQYADYWGGWDGQAQQVVIRYLPESGTQRQALRNGDVDIAMDIATADLAEFDADDNFVVDRADTIVQLYIFFNTQSGATADPAVRKALQLAYDYQSHVDNILAGNGTVAQGPMPSSMDCHADIPAGAQDLDAARAMLEDAGATDLELDMTYLSAIEEMDRAATLLESAAREIGVTINLESITFPAYVDLAADVETTPDLGMIYAFPAYPDPNALLFINYDSQFVANGYNWGAYENPAVDDLVRQAQRSTDQDERCDLYTQAQELIAEDAVAINVSNPKAVSVMRAGLDGFGYRAAHHNTVDVYSIRVGG